MPHFKHWGLGLFGGGGQAVISQRFRPHLIPDLSVVYLSTCNVLPPWAACSFDIYQPQQLWRRKLLQSDVWFWNIQMRWNLNEGQLSAPGWQDLCSALQSVFLFSWIEYQPISWVICGSDNWLKGSQPPRQGRHEENTVLLSPIRQQFRRTGGSFPVSFTAFPWS